MRPIVAATLMILKLALLVSCSEQSDAPDAPTNSLDAKYDSKIMSLSGELDSVYLAHSALCDIALDSMIAGYIPMSNPLNSFWDDSVIAVTSASVTSIYGLTKPSGYYTTDPFEHMPTITEFADTVSGLGSSARQVLRDLDTLAIQYENSTISLATFQDETDSLRAQCLTLPTSEGRLAGTLLMTVKSSADWWNDNAGKIDDFTPQALSGSDRKILTADGVGAARGYMVGLFMGGIPGSWFGAYTNGCTASIVRGVLLGFGIWP